MSWKKREKRKWNGAGTFSLLVTLQKYARRENDGEGLRELSGRSEYD